LFGRALIALLVVAFVAAAGTYAPRPVRAQGRTLAFFAPARGAVNDAAPAQDWTFEGTAGQVVSLIAVTVSGDLDPAIQVIGPDGTLVGENDDLDSLVRDAGLEALQLPAAGTYTVRVMRYAGSATSGEYELTLTPGFARFNRADTFDQGSISWVTPQGDPVALAQGKLQLRVESPGETMIALPPDAEPVQDMYFQASARVLGAPSYAEVGLIFRAQNTPGSLRAYEFKANTNGQWTVLLQDEGGVFALRTWSDHPALDASEWTLAVLARGGDFVFYANGAWLGTVSDTRLAAPGDIGVLIANDPDAAGATTVLFDDAILTTRLGTTYRGLPLALAAWDSSDPRAIIAELAATGLIVPAAERDFYLLEQTLLAERRSSRFELLGSEGAIYGDFALGARVSIVSGADAGCGLVYRWQDERNLDLAYVDTDGGFGLVQTRDGQLTTNVYDLSDMVRADGSKLLVIAQGDQVTLYINGAMVAREQVAPGAGRIGVALLNYEDARADCFWNDLWVWPLGG
jgi:hypothetical protein